MWHINVGKGEDITIRQLAEILGKVIVYLGRIGRPDQTRWLTELADDVSRLRNLAWQTKVVLEEGLAVAYADIKKRCTERY